MPSWYDMGCIWPFVEAYLGWIPSMALYGCARRCEPTPENMQRLLRQLAQWGIRPEAFAQLPFGTLVQMLDALALRELRRCDDPAVQGPYWDGATFPRLELRVAARYRHQSPSRAWARGVFETAVRPQRLLTVFPGRAFRAVLPMLQERGRDFYVHQVRVRRYRDCRGFIELLKVEVTTLYCVVADFEIFLRCTSARLFDEFDTASSSSESDTW